MAAPRPPGGQQSGDAPAESHAIFRWSASANTALDALRHEARRFPPPPELARGADAWPESWQRAARPTRVLNKQPGRLTWERERRDFTYVELHRMAYQAAKALNGPGIRTGKWPLACR